MKNDCIKKLVFTEPMTVSKQSLCTDVTIMEANLPNLFAEDGDEVDQDVAWRFAGVNVAVPEVALAPPAAPVEDEAMEDVDMGGLFG